MKNTIITVSLAAIALQSSSSGAVLLAGWDIWATSGTVGLGNNLAANVLPVIGVTGNAAIPGSSSGTVNNWGTSTNGANNTGTFGTAYTGASTSLVNATDGIYGNPLETAFIDFTISYSGSGSLRLESFNFDGSQGGNQAGRTWTLASTGGAVTAASIQGPTEFPAFNGLSQLDISLTSLADYTIDSGESATFRLSFVGNSNGGNGQRLDNVGFGGTVVPEPSSALLLGSTALLLGFRRNR